MNEENKNFHINFAPLYAVAVFMLLMIVAHEVQAQEIEEVVVTGATIYETE